jgi:hypothetical protein
MIGKRQWHSEKGKTMPVSTTGSNPKPEPKKKDPTKITHCGTEVPEGYTYVPSEKAKKPEEKPKRKYTRRKFTDQ